MLPRNSWSGTTSSLNSVQLTQSTAIDSNQAQFKQLNIESIHLSRCVLFQSDLLGCTQIYLNVICSESTASTAYFVFH